MKVHQPVVMYHYPCPDGVFAALAAHLHFRDSGSNVRWVPNRVYAPETVASLDLQVSLRTLLKTFPMYLTASILPVPPQSQFAWATLDCRGTVIR